MLHLTKHELRVVLAILVALVCSSSGFAELGERLHDLHQRRINAIRPTGEGAKDGESLYVYSKQEHQASFIIM